MKTVLSFIVICFSFILITKKSFCQESNQIISDQLNRIKAEMFDNLTEGIIPFWTNHSIDEKYGGYFTFFNKDGKLITADEHKYITTQTRLIWAFSVFYTMYPDNEIFKNAAKQGADFFIDHFWDKEHGGWYWKVERDGTLTDGGKVVYGQCFGIYSMAEYYMATGDERGLDYAIKTFDCLQIKAADVARGGYYENLETDWTLSEPGFNAGDRKSLDIHMHMMECFTNLYLATQNNIHKRRLQEVIEILKTHMINKESGCGMNQFNLNFEPIPAIAIRRTYNAEREGKLVETPTNTTSYGHNLELLWLMSWANDVLGNPDTTDLTVYKRIAEHSLKYGLDYKYGGVYRDGLQDGPALITDKEFWQNSEALVGFIDIYKLTKDPRYLEAFSLTWKFVKENMINDEFGEWTVLLNREGEPIDTNIGTPWKVCYHTGRALIESIKRIDEILTTIND